MRNAEDDLDTIEAGAEADAADVDYQDRADALREASALADADRRMVDVLTRFIEAATGPGPDADSAWRGGAIGEDAAGMRDAALLQAFARIGRIARSDLKT